MHIRELAIPDAYEILPIQHEDDRGTFFEWYRFDLLESVVGHSLNLKQANSSVSKRGTVRGIHFADIPPGQAKYVTAVSGEVLDFVVDIRVDSPTFGQWDSVRLDSVDRRAVYIGEGLGHAFVALTEQATVSYLVSGVYDPTVEHAINPLDLDIALVFPDEAGELLLSPKDANAPSLKSLEGSSLLPTWDAARSHYRSLARKANAG